MERPLDGSAQERVNSAVRECLSSGATLKLRVERAMLTLLPMLGEKFGPRTTELFERLWLSEGDGVRYIKGHGAEYSNVSSARLKKWLNDLYRLHAWTCFLAGQDPELRARFDDAGG